MQFFIGRLQLLIGGFELLVGGLLFLDGCLQILLGVGQFAFQFFYVPCLAGPACAFAACRFGLRLCHILEAHQQQPLAVGIGQRAHAETHGLRLAVVFERHLPVRGRHALACIFQRNAQFELQSLTRHFHDIERCLTGRGTQVFPGLAMHEQDVAFQVRHHRLRCVGLQQYPPRRFGKIGLPGLPYCFLREVFMAGWRHGYIARHHRPGGGGGRDDPVKLPLAVERLEQFVVVADALRRRQKQHALRLERVMKSRDQTVLQFHFQVDQHVAAAQQVETGEGRVLDRVLHREHHHLADLLFHPVARIVLDEETAQPFG